MDDDKIILLVAFGTIMLLGFMFFLIWQSQNRPYTSIITVERDNEGRIAGIIEKVRYE